MAKGGYKGSSPARETSPEEYSGVWDIVEQYGEQKAGSWPFQADDCAPKSLRFSSALETSLSTTIPNITTFSFSFWYKHVALTRNDIFVTDASYGFFFYQHTDGSFRLNNNNTNLFISNGLYRDPNAWYHCLLTNDGTTLKLYVNGVLDKAQTVGTLLNAGGLYIGRDRASANNWGDFYLAELNFIDGQALTPDEFTFIDGQGILQPKRFTGDYSSGPVYSNLVQGTLDTQYGNSSAAVVFNGSTGSSYSDGIRPTAGQYLSIDFGARFAGASTVKIYGHASLDGATYTGANENLKINGTAIGASDWANNGGGSGQSNATFTLSGGLQTLEWGYSSGSQSTGYLYLQGIEVDGVLLTDAAVGKNSFHVDFSDSLNAEKDQSGLGNDLAHSGFNSSNMPVTGAWTGYGAGTWATTDTWDSLSDATTNFGNNNGTKGFSSTTESWTGTKTSWTGAFGASNRGANGWALKFPAPVTITVNPVATTSIVACPDTSTAVSAGTSTTTFPATITGQVFWFQCNGAPSVGVYNSVLETNPGLGDLFLDSPVNGNEASTGAGGERRGNYCCLNPLAISPNKTPTLSNGNLEIERTASGGEWTTCGSTFVVSSGKYYWELTCPTIGSRAADNRWGVADADDYEFNRDTAGTGLPWLGSATGTSWSMDVGGVTYHNGGSVNSSYTSALTTSDVIGVALDCDSGTLTYYKNGTSLGVAFSNLGGRRLVPAVGLHTNSHNKVSINFGQRAFSQSVPSGHSPLATSFLPEPTIKRGDEAFDVVLWTGNGSNQAIENLRLNPGLVWLKSRDDAYGPAFYDRVRGVNKRLRSDGSTNGVAVEQSQTNGLTAFNSDGFTLGNHNAVNESPDDYVGWVWDAGDTTTTIAAGSLNTSAYNTSQHWSANHASGNTAPTQAFDGTGPKQNGYAHTSGSLTLTFNPALSGRIIVYGGSGGGGADDYTISDGTNSTTLSSNQSYASAPYFEELDFGEQTGITSLYCSPGYTLYGVRVAGKLLVDSNVTPPNVPSIATTVRARPETGFSICNYTVGSNTSQTIAHGLNSAPELIIVKELNQSNHWNAYSSGVGNTKTIYLNLGNAAATNNLWDNTSPTSSVFTVRSGGSANFYDGKEHIAYCFHSVENYCQIGTYQGTNTTSGPFVFCNFRPRFVMMKNIEVAGEEWMIIDSARDTSNESGKTLYANTPMAEADYGGTVNDRHIDILSNGFKVNRGNPINKANKHIYIAFSEHPFASNARAR